MANAAERSEPEFIDMETARHLISPPIPKRTFYHWRQTGRFRIYRPGRSLLVNLKEFREYIRSTGATGSAQPAAGECKRCAELEHELQRMTEERNRWRYGFKGLASPK